jgi:FAD/FMN-containing dehydrogenase
MHGFRRRGGATHLVMSPLEFMRRLAAAKAVRDPHGILNPGVPFDPAVDQSRFTLALA